MRYNTSRVMHDAWNQYHNARRIGLELSFADALRRAWESEKQRCAFERQQWALVLRSLPLMPFDLAL